VDVPEPFGVKDVLAWIGVAICIAFLVGLPAVILLVYLTAGYRD
jgi:hypothetical protein